jgi:glycosyltransferase involved in cell wall biosynthesis
VSRKLNYSLQNEYESGISICIPAYNEEQTIEQVVYDASETLNETNRPGEILVIDDCSNDRTWEILQRTKKTVPILHLRRHATNQGIARTFNELYLWANREFVFLYPADGQWKMKILIDMLELVGTYDLIVARRIKKHYNLSRQIVSWMFNFLPRLLFGTQTYDAGSLKLVCREIYNIPVKSTGVFVEAERIVRAKRLGYRIGSINVDHIPRISGKASGAKLALITQSIADVTSGWIDIFLLSK